MAIYKSFDFGFFQTGEKLVFFFKEGILRELALTSGGSLESKIAVLDYPIVYTLKQEGINIDRLHIAICQAYIEEEERMRRVIL